MAPAPPKAKKQSLVWQSQLQKPPEKGVAQASIGMKEHCDDPSGFCDLLVSEACHCPHLEVFIPNGLLDLDDFCCQPTTTTSASSHNSTTPTHNNNSNSSNNKSSGQPPPQKQFKKKHHLFMTNPVHAMHMASQLEADSSLIETNSAAAAVNPHLHYHPVTPPAPASTSSSSSNSSNNLASSMMTASSPWMYGEEQQRTFALSQAGVQETFFPIRESHIFHEFNTPNPQAPKSVHGPDNNNNNTNNNNTNNNSEVVTPIVASSTVTPVMDSAAVASQKGNDKMSSSLAGKKDKSTTPSGTDKPAATTTTAITTDQAAASPTKPPVAATAPSVSFASPMTTVKTIEQRDIRTPDDSGSSVTASSDDDNKKNDTTERPMEGVVEEKTMDAAEKTFAKDAVPEEKADPKQAEDVVMEEATSNNLAVKDDTKPDEAGATDKSKEDSKDDIMTVSEKATGSDISKEDAAATADKVKQDDGSPSTEKDSSSSSNSNPSANPDKDVADSTESVPENKDGAKVEGPKDSEDDSTNKEIAKDDKRPAGDETKDVDMAKDASSNVTNDDKEEKEAVPSASSPQPEKLTEAKEGITTETKEESSEKSKDADIKEEENTTNENKYEDSAVKGGEETKKLTEKEDAVVKEEPEEDGDKAKQVKSDVDSKTAEGIDSTEKAATRKEGDSETRKIGDAKPESAESKPEAKAKEDPMDVSTDKLDESEVKSGSTSDKNDPPEKAEKDDGKKDTSTDDKDVMEVDTVKKDGSDDTPTNKPDSAAESQSQEKKDGKPDAVGSKPTTVDGEKKDDISSTATPATAASSTIASVAEGINSSSIGASAPKAFTPIYVPVPPPAPAPVPYHLSTGRYLEINKKEEQIKIIRGMLSKRKGKKSKKKRKLEVTITGGATHSALQNLPGALQYSNERALTIMDSARMAEWHRQKATANRRVELWLEHFRTSRRSYWKEANMDHHPANQKGTTSFSEWSNLETFRRTCPDCSTKKNSQHFYGDEIMQCLECPFVGCGPVSVCPRSKHQHMLQHLFLSGHKFAVTCGMRAEVFCFPCGDFVYHSLFDQERERLDMETKFPWLAWSDHPLNRSFDPLQFAQVEEYGIVWRGAKATYPPLVPQEHVDATRFCLQRQALFEGYILEKQWPLMGRRALDFSIIQNQRTGTESWKIPAPVGMYNLGNTCFMSSILQCLVHCVPLQKYFLKDIGHNHKSCDLYRRLKPSDEPMLDAVMAAHKRNSSVCLACEMDSLFLQYYGRATGRDVVSILADLSASPRRSVMDLFDEISGRDEESTGKGEPLVIAKMLHVAWKSGGMGHLAGYEQRDAHEFLHAFLDILGKQICQHRARVDSAIAMSRCGNPFVKQQEQVHHDVIKHLFQGTLRSVLVCEECGTKRTLFEPFLNISLHISKDNTTMDKLSVDNCLEHFTKPEKLADPVDCPTCAKKTSTKKQHTFSKLPKVLCVHLKRFHAALHKKIEDFVSFPAHGLNMGPHLPHWREVTTVPEKAEMGNSSSPEILYDLFGTVNHQGNLQSGHYVTNIKVNDEWYRCNDQHVSSSSEAAVLTSDGAYILFYARR